MEIIRFPKQVKEPRPRPRVKKVRSNDGFKFFSALQVKLIRRTARDAAQLAEQKGRSTAPLIWMVVDILTSSGLRAAECANLRCGDVKSGYGQSSLFVRTGKGNKSGTVEIPQSLKTHLNSFMAWKQRRGQPIGPDDHLLIGQRGPLCAWSIGQITKQHLRKLGLYESGKSAHSLRHSYAVALYKVEKDLRAVQKQLRHASIQTTTIYADVTSQDIQDQIFGLWN